MGMLLWNLFMHQSSSGLQVPMGMMLWNLLMHHSVSNVCYMFHIVGLVGTLPHSILMKGGMGSKDILTRVSGCFVSVAATP